MKLSIFILLIFSSASAWLNGKRDQDGVQDQTAMSYSLLLGLSGWFLAVFPMWGGVKSLGFVPNAKLVLYLILFIVVQLLVTHLISRKLHVTRDWYSLLTKFLIVWGYTVITLTAVVVAYCLRYYFLNSWGWWLTILTIGAACLVGVVLHFIAAWTAGPNPSKFKIHPA